MSWISEKNMYICIYAALVKMKLVFVASRRVGLDTCIYVCKQKDKKLEILYGHMAHGHRCTNPTSWGMCPITRAGLPSWQPREGNISPAVLH